MKYVIKKLTILTLTFLFVSIITFFAFQVIPGDSVTTSLGTTATKEAVEALRQDLGLNENIFVRYIHWLLNFLKGDFGNSLQYKMPVMALIQERMPVTLWAFRTLYFIYSYNFYTSWYHFS